MLKTDRTENQVNIEQLNTETQSKLPWIIPEIQVLDINISTEAQVGSGPQLVG
jgi:hypothetical protein